MKKRNRIASGLAVGLFILRVEKQEAHTQEVTDNGRTQGQGTLHISNDTDGGHVTLN